MLLRSTLYSLVFILLSSTYAFSQDAEALKKEEEKEKAAPWSAATFSGLKFRSIGPSFYTGRISDVAIHPTDESIWYVAVGSGGVWKTENAGTTFTPIFDSQKTFSIGCVTIDPLNPNRVWVGSGENAGGRHFSWGDGIYLSSDNGKTWKKMGLKKSEHISKIVVHPDDSNTIWVAAQGPLWSKGGERGLYKSTDGGKTWKRTLGDDQWTGATDLLIDPRDPDLLYCATWDRHRTVAAYMGGGPGSGIHKSTDGGETWTALKNGIPASNLGKIGMAISPQQPDVLYAAIELDLKKGGVFKSEDRGASWKKMSDAVAGGTGPHYYQELWASPHQFDRIYMANNYLLVSDNGGKKFNRVKNVGKHVDNHAMAFKKNDPDYLMVGTDGGLYESFDLAESWRHFSNMPITQFYKIAVDDAEPFYNVYGGTQDNCTQGGPSRTDNSSGIQNTDWEIVNGGDGHQPATEPGNPDIIYAQSQQGYLNRIDMTTGEHVNIRPQPGVDEPYERFNWDAPILVSPHSPTRLYFGSQRLWKSEDRGDSWTALSEDLTRNENRLELPIMGGKKSYDNPWDVYAMSNFNSITSISESAVNEGQLYLGTDDGLIWTTTDNGAKWKKKEVGSISGVPARAFVNDIKADLHDGSTAYVCLDNHKEGDYRTMLYKTTDGGKSWRSITKGLPDSTLCWRIVQDHVEPGLLFLGTEFGLYFSVDGGGEWVQLKGGLPPISFRDLAIQKRENDLVAATFGRSIYILDDYSALRGLTKNTLNEDALLLPMRDADLYTERSLHPYDRRGSLGTGYYLGDNPPFGAVFSYYLKEGFKSRKDIRKESEKTLIKESKDVPFPGYDALESERRETSPTIWLTIYEGAAASNGSVVRRIEVPASKGMHRVSWDLREVSGMPVREGEKGSSARPSGAVVTPGTYSARLTRMKEGVITSMGEAIDFEVRPLREGTLEGSSDEERLAFRTDLTEAMAQKRQLDKRYDVAKKKLNTLKEVVLRSKEDQIGEVLSILNAQEKAISEMEVILKGRPSRTQIGEKDNMTLNDRLWASASAAGSDYGPTATGIQSLSITKGLIKEYRSSIEKLESSLKNIEGLIENWAGPKY